MKKILFLILFFPPITQSFTNYTPSQDIDPKDKEKFINSDSIYLACERESSENKIEDLLNNKILQLDRKIKKDVESRFKYVVRYGSDKKLDEMLAGKSKIDITQMGRYRKNWYFLGKKISTYVDDQNRVLQCNSLVGKEINDLENCYYLSKSNRSYGYEEYSYSNGVFISSSNRLDRETLSYYTKNESNLGSTTHKYQCYLSNKDEINILQEKYENFLKPLQDEWEKHVNEWIPKEKEQRNKVKI